jgi:isopentenyl-diphosphate delta-isomerase type 1
VSRGSNIPTAERTFADFLSTQWTLLCKSNQFSHGDIESSRAELVDLLSPWADAPIGDSCRYRSYVAADGFPAEFSLSWRNNSEVEVRILFESLSSDLTAHGAQDAGRMLTRRLAAKPGVDISRYLAVEPLFLAHEPVMGRPTIWHSMAKQAGKLPRYKVYLNPQASGVHRALDLVSEAMARVGMADAWRPVAERYEELVAGRHTIEFFALDLEGNDAARAKVYFRHGSVTFEQLDMVASLARRHDSERALRAYGYCYAQRGPIVDEPITCLAFRPGTTGPEEANVYLRLGAGEGADPVMQLLHAERGDTSSYSSFSAAYQAGTSVTRELLSFRTVGPKSPAEIGLYLRFPQYEQNTEKTEGPITDEMVVLCTIEGAADGVLPKSLVHHHATPLHLAFSCYLFDEHGNFLVTRRALMKRTWPGVTTNSCCGHPAPNEPLTTAVRRRLKYELGLSAVDIRPVLPAFTYRAEMSDGVVENEICPVFAGHADPADLAANPDEVDSAEWVPWSTFVAQVLGGRLDVSPWCRLQVSQLVLLGPDPSMWLAVTDGLPKAAPL